MELLIINISTVFSAEELIFIGTGQVGDYGGGFTLEKYLPPNILNNFTIDKSFDGI